MVGCSIVEQKAETPEEIGGRERADKEYILRSMLKFKNLFNSLCVGLNSLVSRLTVLLQSSSNIFLTAALLFCIMVHETK